jgi:methionyl-tRNA synthetase
MSKSRGTFITASSYLEFLQPEYLRYYFAAKLNDHVEDIDLNLDDFIARVNSNLVGKYINIASRSAGFISKRFAGKLCPTLSEQDLALINKLQEAASEIADLYEKRKFSEVIKLIMSLADIANEYINETKPWELAKEEGQDERLHQLCTTNMNLFYLLTIYLKPVMPELAGNVEAFLNTGSLQWQDSDTILLDHAINKYKHLAKRIEPKQVEDMLKKNQEEQQSQPVTSSHSPARHSDAQQAEHPPIAETISFDDFAKVDLRVARIVKAEHVEGADKLLQLTLDIGTEARNVFAGIKSAYSPEDLEGKLTVMVANLAPRKMRFGVSEGMVLAAGPGGKDLWILEPQEGAQPGMKIK